jgi:hypothetical protein
LPNDGNKEAKPKVLSNYDSDWVKKHLL